MTDEELEKAIKETREFLASLKIDDIYSRAQTHRHLNDLQAEQLKRVRQDKKSSDDI